MPTAPETVRPIELAEIREARARISDTIVRTPLVRLELGPGYPDIRLKLENLQPINAYKLRGAANAVAMLPESERRRGVGVGTARFRARANHGRLGGSDIRIRSRLPIVTASHDEGAARPRGRRSHSRFEVPIGREAQFQEHLASWASRAGRFDMLPRAR